jgi:hypothetical protein
MNNALLSTTTLAAIAMTFGHALERLITLVDDPANATPADMHRARTALHVFDALRSRITALLPNAGVMLASAEAYAAAARSYDAKPEDAVQHAAVTPGVIPGVLSLWDVVRRLSIDDFLDLAVALADTLDEPVWGDGEDTENEEHERGRNEQMAFVLGILLFQRLGRYIGMDAVIEAAPFDPDANSAEIRQRIIKLMVPPKPRESAAFLVHSSNGDLWLDSEGYVIDARYDGDELRNIERFDMVEWRRYVRENEPELVLDEPHEIDILDLGYWYKVVNKTKHEVLRYEEPEYAHRDGSEQREAEAAYAARKAATALPPVAPYDPAQVLRNLRARLEIHGFGEDDCISGSDVVGEINMQWDDIVKATGG